jgi:beta-glucuronidase
VIKFFLSFFLISSLSLLAEDETDVNSFFGRPSQAYNPADELLGWIDSRAITSLNGEWSYIVDPMNNGLPESSFFGGFPKNKTQKTGMELIEYNFETAKKITIPGAWNAEDEKLLFYRGAVWLYKKFLHSQKDNQLTHLYIEGSNFATKVFINGEAVGEFIGGYVPFNFDITGFLQEGENILMIQTDNSLSESSVPTQKTDWWPWGGIVGDVYLIQTPVEYILNAYLQTNPKDHTIAEFKVKTSKFSSGKKIILEIPELDFKQAFETNELGQIEETQCFGRHQIQNYIKFIFHPNKRKFQILLALDRSKRRVKKYI